MGDFSKIVKLLIETEIEKAKAVYFGDGSETTLKLILTKKMDPDLVTKSW